jgi:hypothetical protein
MTASPLQLARSFERLKGDLASQSAADLRLLSLIDFWQTLKDKAKDPSYRSYIDEFIGITFPLIDEKNLYDFTLDELDSLRDMLTTLQDLDISKNISDKLWAMTITQASRYFYVGDVVKGTRVCAMFTGGGDVALPDELIEGQNEYESLAAVCEHYRDSRPALYLFLTQIRLEWEAERDAYYHDRVTCLFVDKDGKGEAKRGRLRILEGAVECFGQKATTDEVTLDNQLKTPDDPFVGVVYESLEAVRGLFRNFNLKKESKSFYHAHYAVKDSGQAFTGDSIGLSAGLVAYTELLRPEILRIDRFLSAEIACTGGIDKTGKITKVNEDTLWLKIERAFFSPIKHVVLPQANFAAAQEHVNRLRRKYPRRRLRLIGIEHIRDALDNRNILRDEKICFAPYIAKKTARYGRSVKVQVPILLVLLYLLICLMYPKAWPWFDWNPEYVRLTKTGFVALNKDSKTLWSKEYECDSLTERSVWKIGDFDGDSKNEVAFIPKVVESSPCPSNAHIYLYDHNDELVFDRICAIYGEYPGDTSRQIPYIPGSIDLVQCDDNMLIVTSVFQSNPARIHYRFWSTIGDSLGWYINAGFGGPKGGIKIQFDGKESLLFLNQNNRLSCAALYVLNPYSSVGVSPPYTGTEYNLNGVKKGNHLYYVIFPASDILSEQTLLYHGPLRIIVETDSLYRVEIAEAEKPYAVISYYLDHNLRVIDVSLDDRFVALRNRLVMDGELPAIDLFAYTAQLRDEVRYWIDSDWVTEADLRSAENH